MAIMNNRQGGMQEKSSEFRELKTASSVRRGGLLLGQQVQEMMNTARDLEKFWLQFRIFCNRGSIQSLHFTSVGESYSMGPFVWGRIEISSMSDKDRTSLIISWKFRCFLTLGLSFWYTTAKLDSNIFR